MHARIWTLLALFAGLTSHEGFSQYIRMGETSANTAKKQVFSCQPGPWGELEYFYTYLEAPPEIMELVNTPSVKTQWNLPGKSKMQVYDFLVGAGMNANDVDRIFAESLPFQTGHNIRLFVPRDIVLEHLLPETRRIIYAELRKWPENKFHHRPVILGTEKNLETWFQWSGLPPLMIEDMRKMTYKQGSAVAFSDIPAILSEIISDADERAFLRKLTRERSLILRLKVSPATNFDSLINYWTVDSHAKSALPFLESVRATARTDSEKIDVAELLPPIPRKYLYTFPSPEMGVDGTFPDSFWTAMNFFRSLPNDEFDDLETVMAYARENYEPAEAPFRFGDLLIILDSKTQRAHHASTFIADDIVYTKNSRSMMEPFLFMKMSDVIARQSTGEALKIEGWRKKVR